MIELCQVGRVHAHFFTSCVDPQVVPASMRKGYFPSFNGQPYFTRKPGEYGQQAINPAIQAEITTETATIGDIDADVQHVLSVKGTGAANIEVIATNQESSGIYLQALCTVTGDRVLNAYFNVNIAGGAAALAPYARQYRVSNTEGHPLEVNLPTIALVSLLAEHLAFARLKIMPGLMKDHLHEVTFHFITHSLCLWHSKQDTLANEVGSFDAPDTAFLAVERGVLLELAGAALRNWFKVVHEGFDTPRITFHLEDPATHLWDKSKALNLKRPGSLP